MFRSTYLHTGWEFAEESWAEGLLKVGTVVPSWLPAQVPGHVHLDLVANGVIADPFKRMNELGCQWVDGKSWSYRTRFNYRPDPAYPKVVLMFEGLDTLANVFLNGDLAANSGNMFMPLEIDLTGRLRDGENELKVVFDSAVQVGKERRTAYFEKEGYAENIRNFDERAFVRKAQYMSGWDWGPRLVSCGIWKAVRLMEYGSRITHLDVHAKQTPEEEWEVAVSTEVDGEGEVTVTILNPEGDAMAEHSSPTTFVVHDPHIWNTHERGEQPLYTIVATLKDWQGKSVHTMEKKIGFRTVTLDRRADSFGESFEFILNGRSLWARGANWIPDHSFPSTVSRAQYRKQLERAVDLGCNMLRVWGGGLYETDEFYDLCDELGILVWQDFPFGCSYYPDADDHQAELTREASVNVRRLRHHASLALWCGNNENHQMWNDKWGGAEFAPSRYHGWRLYHDTLPKVLAAMDPERAYIPSSAIGATTDGPTDNPNRDGYGDVHNWDVWHGRGDWRYYAESGARFSSEYGFASSCHLDVWRDTIAKEDWGPHTPVVQWHDKTAKGHDVFHGLVQLHYPAPQTLEDWTYYSQLNQRDALRFGVEFYRRSEFCKGSLIWQLNDCWPVQSWAILDCYGNYKALGYELKRLHRNAMCSLVRDKDKITLWGVNNEAYRIDGGAEVEAYDLQTGERLRSESVKESLVESDQRAEVASFSIAGLDVSRLLIVGKWAGDQTWLLAAEPKSAAFAAPCELEVSTAGDGYLEIRNSTPLVDLVLLDGDSPKEFIDNFLTVPQPGVFRVRVNSVPKNISARSLAGVHEVELFRGAFA
ncbi:MAG TPA: hypothetical protein VG944_20465 [Fimbriimonas sp.]|nr:hypothetical protein [Fimbriimonas sp.]